jgi:hypothetical protein
MFGFGEKKTEIKTVEDYVRSEFTQVPPVEGNRAPRGLASARFKSMIAPFIGFLILLALLIAGYGEIAVLTSDVAELRSQIKADEVAALRTQVSELAAQLAKATKTSEQLRSDIARLEHDLETEKAQRVRTAKVTAPKKPAVVVDKKKKLAPRRH